MVVVCLSMHVVEGAYRSFGRPFVARHTLPSRKLEGLQHGQLVHKVSGLYDKTIRGVATRIHGTTVDIHSMPSC